jgi:hypothetical protein
MRPADEAGHIYATFPSILSVAYCGRRERKLKTIHPFVGEGVSETLRLLKK